MINTTKKMCRLKISSYCHEQSPRAWFKRFSKVVKSHGYIERQSDHSLFIKHSLRKKVTVLIIYVNELKLTRDDFQEMEEIKRIMA